MAKKTKNHVCMASHAFYINDPYLVVTFSSTRCVDGAYRGWYRGYVTEGATPLNLDVNEAVVEIVPFDSWFTLSDELDSSFHLRVERDAMLSESYGNSFYFFGIDGKFLYESNAYCTSRSESLKHIYEVFSDHEDAALCVVLNARYPVISVFHKPN